MKNIRKWITKAALLSISPHAKYNAYTCIVYQIKYETSEIRAAINMSEYDYVPPKMLSSLNVVQWSLQTSRPLIATYKISMCVREQKQHSIAIHRY